jgi:prephenate dehydrogenase
VIDSFKSALDSFAQAIKAGDTSELSDKFSKARAYRNSFNEKKASSYTANYELWVDVAEQKGIIAKVACVLSENDINIKSIGVIHNREYANGILQIVIESKEARDKCLDLLKKMNYTVYDK